MSCQVGNPPLHKSSESLSLLDLESLLTILEEIGQEFLVYSRNIAPLKDENANVESLAKDVLICYAHYDGKEFNCTDRSLMAAAALGAAFLEMTKHATGLQTHPSPKFINALQRARLTSGCPVINPVCPSLDPLTQLRQMIERQRATFLQYRYFKNMLEVREHVELGCMEKHTPGEVHADKWPGFVCMTYNFIMNELDEVTRPSPVEKTGTIIKAWIKKLDLPEEFSVVAQSVSQNFIQRHDDGNIFFDQDGAWLIAAAALGACLANCRYSSVVRLAGSGEAIFFCVGKFTYGEIWAVRTEMVKFESEVLAGLRAVDVSKQLSFSFTTSDERQEREKDDDEYMLPNYVAQHFKPLGGDSRG